MGTIKQSVRYTKRNKKGLKKLKKLNSMKQEGLIDEKEFSEIKESYVKKYIGK